MLSAQLHLALVHRQLECLRSLASVTGHNKHENGYNVEPTFKASNTFSNGGETWIEVCGAGHVGRAAIQPCLHSHRKCSPRAEQVGKGRLYTPCEDDVGTVLKCEVVAIDTASPYGEQGKTFSNATARVRPAPSPPKRVFTPISPPPKNVVSAGKFTALTYNLLADLYATVRHLSPPKLLISPPLNRAGPSLTRQTQSWCEIYLHSKNGNCCGPLQAEQFSYCQPWMLAWGYRKQNLLKELLNYDADIMCLQVADLSTPPEQPCMHGSACTARVGTVYTTSPLSAEMLLLHVLQSCGRQTLLLTVLAWL